MKSFKGRQVVSCVSLFVNGGEVVGLLGPNGAGKTTAFYMLVGLIQADEGSIFLNGEEVTSMPIHIRAGKGLGYLPQESSIFRDLTVEENINAILELQDSSRERMRFRLEKLLKNLSLKNIRNSKGRELSGGERRRVELARTLALKPHFILLDEPFAGVDPLAVKEIQKVIEDLKNSGIGILITDHSVRETLDIVDRAYVMSQGSLLAEGTPEEIINNEKAQELYLGESFRV